ncbi:MAG TPA: hypothetical protein VHF26_10055 [Trebonia sp.]|nr:hypothetical protein [Trebonia sp.]
MAEWWSIEVFSGEKLPGSAWRYAYEDDLTEAAITNGALYYEWHDTEYGVIFEVLFPGDAAWESFRALPAVRAALDGVPDPVDGLLIYRGRGGASGARKPRKPKPAPGAAALELGEPEEERRLGRLKRPRRLWYNAAQADELLREPGADPGRIDEPDRGVPERSGPARSGSAGRDIAAFARSFW